MVKICEYTYPKKNYDKYINYFEKYPYKLSPFQMWGIQSIIEGNNCLVTAMTGSGKTLLADFAIDYFTSSSMLEIPITKKVIYCSPIKALSNQKYNEFKEKYTNISFGIITGDIKESVNAQVLIMTTEILMNNLYAMKNNLKHETLTLAHTHIDDFDIINDIGCVIFDEVHYINDKDRGYVWEQSILMLPTHIQLVMLSATIENPYKFASWIETRTLSMFKPNDLKKEVFICGTKNRIVPLIHYAFITCNNGFFKLLKNKILENELKKTINIPLIIKQSDKFNELNFNIINKSLLHFKNKNQQIKRSFALNQLLKYMVENNLLNAICFVFSRKLLEQMADEVTISLLEDDSKIPYTIHRDCDNIMRSKFINYNEYINTPEYLKIVSLLEKGIGIHHSGILSIYRELIEVLFIKGSIKLLFATETFSVGINAPTRSVIFEDLEKYTEDGNRLLLPHEYNQMSGRAGRRGIDTVGHVFHLNNTIKCNNLLDIKQMLNGTPQNLVSKFKISYNLILSLIDIQEYDFYSFISKSMLNKEQNEHICEINNEIDKYKQECINIKETYLTDISISYDIIYNYYLLTLQRDKSINKQKKDIDKKINDIQTLWFIPNNINDIHISSICKYYDIQNKINNLSSICDDIKISNSKTIQYILTYLLDNNFIIKTEQDTYILTSIGNIATQLRELNSILVASFIENNIFNDLNITEIIGVFSCFIDIKINNDYDNNINNNKDNELYLKASNTKITNIINEFNHKLMDILDYESSCYLNITDLKLNYNLIELFMEWSIAICEDDCKFVIQKAKNMGIFLGDFSKGIIHLVNMFKELEIALENINNIELLQKIKNIPDLMMKYVVTTQSLYL